MGLIFKYFLLIRNIFPRLFPAEDVPNFFGDLYTPIGNTNVKRARKNAIWQKQNQDFQNADIADTRNAKR